MSFQTVHLGIFITNLPICSNEQTQSLIIVFILDVKSSIFVLLK
jgi:hypothetical protein